MQTKEPRFNIHTLPLTVDLAMELTPSPVDLNGVSWDKRTWELIIKAGPCKAFLLNDKVVAIIGMAHKGWVGMAEAWLIKDESITARQMVVLTKMIRNLLDEYQESDDFRRIQMIAVAENEVNVGWAEKIGFQIEGFLRKYDAAGRDCVIMGRVK